MCVSLLVVMVKGECSLASLLPLTPAQGQRHQQGAVFTTTAPPSFYCPPSFFLSSHLLLPTIHLSFSLSLSLSLSLFLSFFLLCLSPPFLSSSFIKADCSPRTISSQCLFYSALRELFFCLTGKVV